MIDDRGDWRAVHGPVDNIGPRAGYLQDVSGRYWESFVPLWEANGDECNDCLCIR